MSKPTLGIGWVYLNSEPGLWTVGFYTPEGVWHPDSDYNSREEAAARVRWLNGGSVAEALPKLVESVAEGLHALEQHGDNFHPVIQSHLRAALAKLEAK